ncbi:hypothetical protein MHU86_8982 [Fragilaria crotonensis]|nr:hypothetical protein MHU86_8982 [Fragilaria crotonensis]
MTAFGKNFKAIPLKHQPSHVKFIHNQLPLGQKYQRSDVKDEKLKLCPTCLLQEENIHHFLHCSQNPARGKSISAMLRTILKDDHPSRPAFASCVEQYLTHPGQRVHFHNDKLSSRLDDILQTAIEEQNLIGWHQLLLGYLSRSGSCLQPWTLHPGKLNLSAGRSRTHGPQSDYPYADPPFDDDGFDELKQREQPT